MGEVNELFATGKVKELSSVGLLEGSKLKRRDTKQTKCTNAKPADLCPAKSDGGIIRML